MQRWLCSFGAFAIAVGSLAATHDFNSGPAQSRRPDVIVVLTDQQRADAFGAAGATDLHTPVMDRLARQGVLFTRAFTATPQCSPSRAALLTGRYPHRTGVMGNTASEGARWHRRQPARRDVAGPRSVAPDARADLRWRRIRDGLFRQVASRRHPGRLRVRGARFHDRRHDTRPPRRRVPAEAPRERTAQALAPRRVLVGPPRHLQRLHCGSAGRASAGSRAAPAKPDRRPSTQAVPAASLSRRGSGEALRRRRPGGVAPLSRVL